MKNISVEQALIDQLENMKFTFEIPVLGELIKNIPIANLHDELVKTWRTAARRLAYGAETHPSNTSYRQYWLDFIEQVAASILQQKPVSAS